MVMMTIMMTKNILELQESNGSHQHRPHSSDDDNDDDDDDDDNDNNDDDDDDKKYIEIARIKWFSSTPPTQF